MATAIKETFTSVLGSSVTTIAGFIALCFMSFTLGADLGIVMAKGVFLGVIGCVTTLPALILVLDKPLSKTMHKSLIPKTQKLSEFIVKRFPAFLIVFVILLVPAFIGYQKTNEEVYYDLGECLPEDMDYVIANSKLRDDFDIMSTHMVLVDADTSSKDKHSMVKEMEQVDGVKYVLSLESVVGSRVPEEVIPDSIKSVLESDKWELMLINSEYKVATDDVSSQLSWKRPSSDLWFWSSSLKAPVRDQCRRQIPCDPDRRSDAQYPISPGPRETASECLSPHPF